MKNGGNTINNYQPLYQQAQKLFRHNWQGSFKTRQRYFEAYRRFLKFVAERYRVQKLSNISGKHLSAYIAYMQEKGLAPSTIKTDLAAIRFWHDQIPNARYNLPGTRRMIWSAVPLERWTAHGARVSLINSYKSAGNRIILTISAV